MAKMNCKCGCILSTTQVPNDIHLRVYTDKEWENIFDCDIIEPWKIPLPKYKVWKCPKCGRIYVFEEGNDTPIMKYILEEDQIVCPFEKSIRGFEFENEDELKELLKEFLNVIQKRGYDLLDEMAGELYEFQ